MTFAPAFGVLLRGFRREAALTQEALAERAGLSVEAIRVLEAGRRRHPRPSTIKQLVAALGLSEADLSRLEEAARRRQAASHDLPADIDDFSGRTAELRQLVDALGREAPAVALVSVAGMGGVGKTTLAVHGARLLADDFPDGFLYVSLGGHGGGRPAEPLELLQRLLRALGVQESQIPREVAEAAARYRSALAGRKLLVLLDDAASSDQVAPLIPGTSGSAVLITSRKQLTGVAGLRQLRLDVLSDQEALELFAAVLGEGRVEEEREAALAVARLCGHLPLALRIAAGSLSGQPDKKFRRLADELESSRAKVLSADGGGVRASIDLSLRALAADPRTVARTAAAVFPIVALLGVDDFALRTAAAALDLPIDEVEDALEHLVDVSLLETPQLHRYRMHDLVREIGREKTRSSDREAVSGRVLDHYLALGWRIEETSGMGAMSDAWRDPRWSISVKDLDLETATDLLDADRANCVAAVRAAAGGSPAERLAVVRIAAGINDFGQTRKRWSEWRAILEAAAGVVGQFDDPVSSGMIHFDLGLVCNELEEFEQGVEYLTQAARSAREMGEQGFEVTALVNLGHALERANRLPEARAVAQQVQDHRPDERIASWIELILGMAAGKEQDLAGQRAAFERSLELYRAAGAPPGNLAMRYRIIGESLAEAGQDGDAEASYREALSRYRELDDQLNVAAVLERLGATLVSAGSLDEAEAVLSEALLLAQEQAQWDCEARIQVALGNRLSALGRKAEAADAWRRALGIYEYHGAAATEDVRLLLDRA
ncbi:NB-ARC domain-containing protein [Kribbella sp. NPDC056861]|uniref:ATP-binding protein n=1 Tax=Kribbella sp. NPDC056861 TaxID=3154857 RepID=UPI00343CDC71